MINDVDIVRGGALADLAPVETSIRGQVGVHITINVDFVAWDSVSRFRKGRGVYVPMVPVPIMRPTASYQE